MPQCIVYDCANEGTNVKAAETDDLIYKAWVCDDHDAMIESRDQTIRLDPAGIEVVIKPPR